MGTEKLTSLERVKTTLHHKQPDKIPFDLGASTCSGMNITTYSGLRSYLRLEKKPREIVDVTQQTAVIHRDVQDRLKVDVFSVAPSDPDNRNFETDILRDGAYYKRTDKWGIEWKMPIDNGHYFDMVANPLREITTVQQLEQYQLPDPCDDAMFATMKQRNDALVAEGKATIINADCAGIWEMSLWINGFEKFFTDMASNKTFAHAMMRKITDYKLAYWKKVLDVAGENVLIIQEADDLATQKNTLISPRMYREMIHPYHKELYQFIHAYAKQEVFLFYHSCGACKALIPYLIDEGVNILNPVQISAAGMDPFSLKQEFGKDLTFWGGGVDTQQVLPHGTPQQIRDNVKRNVEALSKDGGFVFTTVHNVQSDVSPENYMIMWEAFQELVSGV